MTLLEVVCVVCIVVILIPLLSPVRDGHSGAIKAQAKNQIQVILAAINQYEITYSKPPGAPNSPDTNQPSDFTYGTWGTSAPANGITNAAGPQANNAEIMAALLDLTSFPNGNLTLNTNHSRNPQHIVFVNLRSAPDAKSPGLGTDGVLRDPWGNPYIITIHYGPGNKCRDIFHSLASVSEKDSSEQGFNGLVRTNGPPYFSSANRDSFEANGRVMVWSLGPDGNASPRQKANEGVNRDNIKSW